ncbi:MAG: hypothetical protein K0R93_2542 [Anaerosolibacter sp.]|jgi:hypothetical protein|uniref:DUF6544 family protein n=1 Tax=Anaerosolibacter sp. TaxID=1872527 RepID=UPI0026216869|nr:DUF6544 family protein [Anaerosolibacter sp.]MDF2547644.1 hypothetical protein [Anaerosolibacter sp.]
MDKKYILLLGFLILAAIIVFAVFKSQGLRRTYKAEVLKGLERTGKMEQQVVTEEDIKDLPGPVQKYLRYVGVVGKEKVNNLRITFDGEFKTDTEKDWAKVDVEQYSFLDDPTRLYFMRLNMSGVPVIGLHHYENGEAMMLIKLAGLFTVADGRGPEMNQGETVTVFNDMCLLMPATLIDKRIQWEEIDPLTVKATFENKGNRISALLYFNEKGELTNFVSDDRYYSPTGTSYQQVRWSTPIKDYKEMNGVKIVTYGEAIWHFPEGEYCYAKFNVKEIEYNRETYK